MPKFNYIAKKGALETITSTIDAQTKEEALEKISLMGLLAVKIVQENVAPVAKNQSHSRVSLFSKVKLDDITVFSRQLSSLVKSGVPFLEGISIISRQANNHYLRTVLGDIGFQVRNGKSFSQALMDYPNIFSPLYVSMIRASEDSGDLVEALLRVVEYQKNEADFRSRVKSALIYPLFIAFVGTGTILFMLIYVIPKLIHIFANMGESLPMPTKILISISNWMSHYWVWLILAIIAVVIILKRGSKNPKERLVIGMFKLNLPLYGGFVKKNELVRFSYAFQMLIKGGVPILRALQMSIPVFTNEFIKSEFELAYKELVQGSSFGDVLSRSKIIPSFMSSLISVGEKSGRLDEALGEIVSAYDREINDTLKNLISFFEPLMILVMGLVVGFVVIAMLLPMFQMSMMIK